MESDNIKELTNAVLDLKGCVERMSERQDEMLDDVKKIKEAVYNPDSGLYARVRALELWKESTSRIQWAVILTLLGLITTTIYKIIFGLG